MGYLRVHIVCRETALFTRKVSSQLEMHGKAVWKCYVPLVSQDTNDPSNSLQYLPHEDKKEKDMFGWRGKEQRK